MVGISIRRIFATIVTLFLIDGPIIPIWSIDSNLTSTTSQQIYYGDFVGNLPDPQGIGIRGKVYVINETALQIINFSYNGQAPDLYFWIDREPQLTSSGVKIPTFEFGVTPIGKYSNAAQRVVLILPAHHKVDKFISFGLWCLEFSKDYGTVKLAGHRVPKAKFLSNQLRGSRYNVQSGPILLLDERTIKVFGFMFDGDKAPDGYFFIGRGANVVHDAGVKVPIRGRDTPDMITAMNERYNGARDIILDLPETYDVYHSDWLSIYCYKFRVDFGHVLIDNLTNLTQPIPPYVPMQKRFDDIELSETKGWPITHLLGTETRRNFTFQLGVPGGRRGYQSMARARPGKYVWYVNGYLAEMYLLRGVSYTFNVEGGDDKSTSDFYNPLYISDDPFGGFQKLSADERQQVKILAGGQQYAGRLCLWSPDNTDSDASKYETFIEYRRTLRLKCANSSPPATFQWTPTVDTPDTVYFQSYTAYNMGWKIHIVDKLPDDVPDVKEEPYQYEIWLEHQSLVELPRTSANGASSTTMVRWMLLVLLAAIGCIYQASWWS